MIAKVIHSFCISLIPLVFCICILAWAGVHRFGFMTVHALMVCMWTGEDGGRIDCVGDWAFVVSESRSLSEFYMHVPVGGSISWLTSQCF